VTLLDNMSPEMLRQMVASSAPQMDLALDFLSREDHR
jgi:hypothetical protein